MWARIPQRIWVRSEDTLSDNSSVLHTIQLLWISQEWYHCLQAAEPLLALEFSFYLVDFCWTCWRFLILHSQQKRKIKTPNNFFQSLQSLREYYFLDITIKLAEISRTFSNQHGGLNSLIPVAMALFLLSHQSPYSWRYTSVAWSWPPGSWHRRKWQGFRIAYSPKH